MTVRPSVRFDVFKRDNFTCAYCGRKPPDVTLELDHIIPLAEGGTDDPENLTTACWDCNRGKGPISLDREPAALPDLGERAEFIREREAQLRAYHEALSERQARQDEQFNRVWNAWFEAFDADDLPRNAVPYESVLRRYIDQLGPDEVIHAIRIATDRFRYPNSTPVRYFIGVCKRKLAESEGRVVKCIYCQKRIVLDPGEDPTVDWWHVDCKPEGQDG